LRPFAAEPVHGAVPTACQLGDRRWQCRANVAIERGLLPTLCTGAAQLPMSVPSCLRARQSPRAALMVGDREAIGRPISNHSVVKVRKDYIIWGLQVTWRTDPHRNRHVNWRRQQKRRLRQFGRGKLEELRRGWWQKLRNRWRWREAVGRVTEEDCRLLDKRTFVRRWRGDIIGDRTKVWGRLERSVQKREAAIAIACMRPLRV